MGKKGFTLVELLVVLGIISVGVILMNEFQRGVVHLSQQARRKIERQREWRGALEFMTRELRMLVRGRGGGLWVRDVPEAGWSGLIRFHGGVTAVRYRRGDDGVLIRESMTPESCLALWMQTGGTDFEKEFSPVAPEVIARGVEEMRVRCFHSGQWSSEGTFVDLLPVRVEVGLRGETGELMTAQVVIE